MHPLKSKVIHLTSAHGRYDTRIFIKMCSSLARHDYDVALVVSDGKGDEVKNGVRIYDVGEKPHWRLLRMTKTVSRVFEKAKNLDGNIYHLHDPELMPIGLKLKKMGKKVIFDAHEDLPIQLLNKPYLNAIILKMLSIVAEWYQSRVLKKFDAVVAATPYIRNKLSLINMNCIDINNYPVLTEKSLNSKDYISSNSICYIGGLTYVRGIKELISALQYCDKRISLIICGNFENSDIESEIRGMPGWERVDYRGYLDQQGVHKVMSRSFAGIVTLHPTLNYLDSLPVKMFEYMSAELPVIASNFEYWKPIINAPECGLSVDPLKPEMIAKAIEEIFFNKTKGLKMGLNGRDKIENIYNWKIEKEKLILMYDNLEKKSFDVCYD